MQLIDSNTDSSAFNSPFHGNKFGRNYRGYRNMFNPPQLKTVIPRGSNDTKFWWNHTSPTTNRFKTFASHDCKTIGFTWIVSTWSVHQAKIRVQFSHSFQKKTHFSPNNPHITRISSCSNCSEFCKNDLKSRVIPGTPNNGTPLW